jgi:hypothetical protein
VHVARKRGAELCLGRVEQVDPLRHAPRLAAASAGAGGLG